MRPRRPPRRPAAALAAVALATAAAAAAVARADGPPWDPRRVPGMRPNLIARARVPLDAWPPEPASPGEVDPDRLGHAFRELCGMLPPRTARAYAGWMAQYGARFGTDPFLLGALAWRRSHCLRDHEGDHEAWGLTGIVRRFAYGRFDDGHYVYRVRDGDAWVERRLDVSRFPFGGPRLKLAEANLYHAAAVLRAWREQHADVDRAFDQAPHRHFVSHFVWGDRVRSDRDEDRILTDRRRLLRYYGALGPRPTVRRLGVTFSAPLDGAPRVVSSGLGAPRDGGGRDHRGNDVESEPGEPVRAVADGVVIFAGVDLPRPAGSRQLAPDGYDAVPRDALGPGGRYVCVRHRRGGDAGSLRSCYMHLETVSVRYGDRVARGAPLGTVGRTGMRRSAAHLHLELHGPDGLLDPLEVLAGLLIGDPDAEPPPAGG